MGEALHPPPVPPLGVTKPSRAKDKGRGMCLFYSEEPGKEREQNKQILEVVSSRKQKISRDLAAWVPLLRVTSACMYIISVDSLRLAIE